MKLFCLSCARFVRALGNLDGALGSGGAGSQPLSLAPKSRPEQPRRSRTPLRDDRPPLRRSVPGRDNPDIEREELPAAGTTIPEVEAENEIIEPLLRVGLGKHHIVRRIRKKEAKRKNLVRETWK